MDCNFQIKQFTLDWCLGHMWASLMKESQVQHWLIFDQFSQTTYRTPPIRVQITHRVFGSTGPGANTSVEVVGPLSSSGLALLLAWVDVCVCMSERKCKFCLSVPAISAQGSKIITKFKHQLLSHSCTFTLCLAGTDFYALIFNFNHKWDKQKIYISKRGFPNVFPNHNKSKLFD